MANENAIKSALRRSLHFENITSGNIGYIDNSYYKFFIYNNSDFIEIEIMDGTILSARRNNENSNSNMSLMIYTSNTETPTKYYFSIIGIDSTNLKLDVEYSFGLFELNSIKSEEYTKNTESKTISAGESKYYGILISDSSKIANTVNISDLNLGKNSTLTVQTIKLGNWNIQNANEETGNTVNITYKEQ